MHKPLDYVFFICISPISDNSCFPQAPVPAFSKGLAPSYYSSKLVNRIELPLDTQFSPHFFLTQFIQLLYNSQ